MRGFGVRTMAGLDEARRPALTALIAVGVPVAGGIAAGMSGNGDGPVFQAGAVLGAGVTTLLATRRGLWWLVPAQPMVVVPAAVLGMLLAEPDGTTRTKMGTDSVSALHHAFVITLVAVAVVAIVAVLKAATGRGREPRSARGGGARGSTRRAAAADGTHRAGAHRG